MSAEQLSSVDVRGVLPSEVLVDGTSVASSSSRLDRRDLARGSDDGSVLKRCTQPSLKSGESFGKWMNVFLTGSSLASRLVATTTRHLSTDNLPIILRKAVEDGKPR